MYHHQLKVQNPSHKTYTIECGKVVMQKKNWSANMMIIIHFLALYAWLVLSTVYKKYLCLSYQCSLSVAFFLKQRDGNAESL